MKIYFASDHAGFELKSRMLAYVASLGFIVEDCGAYSYNPEDDYPDFIRKAAAHVSDNPQKSLAIIFGGSGQGEAMVANKYPHVRATVYYGGNRKIIDLSREHNDANTLSIGARFVNEREARAVIRAWLLGQYSLAEKHKRRIEKLEGISRDAAYLLLAQERMNFLHRAYKSVKRRLSKLFDQPKHAKYKK